MLKKLVKKSIRMRKYLLSTNRGKRNYLRMCQLVKQFENLLAVNPSDVSLARYMKEHFFELMELLPSTKQGNSIANEVKTEIESIINKHEKKTVPHIR